MTRKNQLRLGFAGLLVVAACVFLLAGNSATASQPQAPGRTAARFTDSSQAATPTPEKDLPAVLVPFVLLAAAIERVWEAIFDTVERAAMTSGRLMGVSADSVHWMFEELAGAQNAVNDVAKSFNAQPQSTAVQQSLTAAEARLRDAQLRIEGLPQTASYVSLKRAITIFGSLVFGLIISVASQQLLFFQAAGFDAIPKWLDIILTGLVIGVGTGPLHSLIGTLESVRDTVSALGNLAQGSAMKNAAMGTQALIPPPVIAEFPVTPEAQAPAPLNPENTLQAQRRIQKSVQTR